MTRKIITHCQKVTQLVFEFAEHLVVARFDRARMSSDGGAILLKAADRALGLTKRLARCLVEKRERGKVRHELVEMLMQRVFGIACGYPDCNDAERLREDPIQKLLVGRDPVEGDPLASQPTLSRFENSVGPKALYRLGEALAEVVIERHRKRLGKKARRITLELDLTADPTYGDQQLTLFNGYYNQWCYLPLLGFLRFNDEPDEYLFTAVLRPGTESGERAKGAIGILKRVLERLRKAFPWARLCVRLDGGFATPEILDFLDAQKLGYVVGMAKNAVLEQEASSLLERAHRLSEVSVRTEHLYGECTYAAKGWQRQRRIVIKAEVVRLEGREPRDNPRFLVTNMTHSPQWVYERIYCPRGDLEKRIGELKNALRLDLTSCTRFWANQFRILLTAAAFVLIQELRLRAARTDFAHAQAARLREQFLKIGVQVVVSVRRVVLHMPNTFPYVEAWRRTALSLRAASP